MQRFWLVALLAAPWTLHAAAPKAPSVHEKIAGYAAVIGNNLLAKDIKDEHGLLLLRFARALEPTNNTALLTMGFVERGKNPDPIETKVTEAKLYSVMADQAHLLRQREWPKNTKAGQLALLYYRMAERARPTDQEIMLGLMKLRVRGVEGDLGKALAQTSDLKDIFGKPEKPEPQPKMELAEVDRNIAKYAAIWATNRLATDLDDSEGLVLLRLAGCLTPESNTVLLTLALLEREKKPEVLTSDVTEEKLLDVMTSRAAKLYAKAAGKNDNAGRLSLLYLKVAERFRPEDKTVILGLMKLRTKGFEGGLDELLNAGAEIASVQAPKEEQAPPGERPEPELPLERSTVGSKFKPPRAWLEFAKKRDKLPAEEQLLLIAEELKRLHGGTEIKMRPPTIEEGKIVGLSFQRNRSLKRIEPLYGLPLRTLSVQACSSLESLDGLEGMHLTQLSLQACKTLRSLKPLRGMKLTSIVLQACSSLESLDGLEGMQLTQLNIHGCKSLRSLGPLKEMPLVELKCSAAGLSKADHRILEKIPTLEKVTTGDQKRDERILAATKKLRDKLAKERR